MFAAGVFISLVLGYIGVTMLREKGWEHKAAGTVIILLAGIVLTAGANTVG